MVRRAKKPIDQAAADCADQKFYDNHPGDPELFDSEGNWIPLHPTASKHTANRTEWMDLFQECGGEIEGDDGGKTDPCDPVVPCDDDDELVLVEVLEQAVAGQRSELRSIVASREQYVNLDDQVEPAHFHVEYGRIIRLVARVAWKSGKTADLAGHMVVWKEAHLDDERVIDLEGSEHHGFGSAGSQVSEYRNSTDGKGWTSVAEFYLSTYGGDRFSLSASLEGGSGQIPAGAYQVWKKFWYQVTEMERPQQGRYELPERLAKRCEQWFRETFIRLDEKKTGSERTVAKYRPDIPEEEKDEFGELYFERDHLSPFKAHIMMVATFVTEDSRVVAATIEKPLWRFPQTFRIYRQSEDDKPWLLYAVFRRQGRARWRQLSPKRVRAIREGDESSWLRYRIDVDFSRGVLKPSPKRPFEIRLRLGVYRFTGLGGNSQHSFVPCA